MAQAGIHGLAGMAVQKLMPKRTWLMLGIVLGSLFPDLDNLAVAVATLTGKSIEGLHRSLTHSIFFAAVVYVLFLIIGRAAKQPRWSHLGSGLGIGLLMHTILDLLIWFDGVELLWPIPMQVNLWADFTAPDWWMKLMMPAEMLFIALFFMVLWLKARRNKTDRDYIPVLRIWTIIEGVLFVIFLVLVFVMSTGFMTIYGAIYLLSLILAIGVSIRMRKTIETA